MTQVEKAKKLVAEKNAKCQATTRKGNPCKAKAVKDGFCATHNPNKGKKKEVKLADPVGGVEVLTQLIDATINSASSNVEIPAELVVDPVLKEVLDRAEQVAVEKKDAEVIEGLSITRPEAEAILAQHEALLKNVSMDAVSDKMVLAAILRDVVTIPANDLEHELKMATKIESDISYEVKTLRENVKASSEPVQADTVAQIALLDEQVLLMKHKKAIILAAMDAPQAEPVVIAIDDWGGMDKSWEDKDKVPFFTKVRAWFKKHVFDSFPVLLVVSCILAFLAALAIANLYDATHPGDELFSPRTEIHQDAPHKQNDTPVAPVVEEPVGEHVPADFADVGNAKPVDVVVPSAPIAGGHPIDMVDEDSGQVFVTTVVVQDGDTLWTIAEKVYGDGNMWTAIYDANQNTINAADARNLQDPGHWIYAGQSLDVPTMNELALNDH